MKEFFGREFELEELESLYASDKFEMIVVYGRRRTGKTALFNKFIQDKNVIYYTPSKGTEQHNAESLSQAAFEFDHPGTDDPGPVYPSLKDALNEVFRRSMEQRIIFAIDELPDLLESIPGSGSILQHLIDQYEHKCKLFFLVNGSSISVMEDEVLRYKAPLYGRKTAQFKLAPFTFAQMRRFVPDFSGEQQAMCYGFFGGIPKYLQMVDDSKPVEECVKRLFFKTDGLLFEEPYNLLKDELREPGVYQDILHYIASGASRIKDISDKAHITTSSASKFCETLCGLDLVAKETPAGESTEKKTLYSIKDHMVRFWYTFVYPNKPYILRNMTGLVWNRVEKQISTYMGPVFEEICQEYLWEMLKAGKCDVFFTDLGHWWGNNPVTKSEQEIDIMGIEDDHTALFAECKWTNAPVDQGVINGLITKASMFPYPRKVFYFFAKSGFTQGALDLAANNPDLRLISFDQMIEDLDQLPEI